MVKRFTDGDIWKKNWFLQLEDKQKLLTKFIYDNCDCAGIYEICWHLLKFYFTSPITKEDFLKIKQVRFLDEDTIFVEDFVNFQCGVDNINELNPNNNAHKGIIKRLEKYNLFLAPAKGLGSPSLGAQEKEKEKEKENISSLVLSSLNEKTEIASGNCSEFKKPTIEEIREYCQSKNYKTPPEEFYDHYESKGWVIGKSQIQMKDWQAAVRIWERNRKTEIASGNCSMYPSAEKTAKMNQHYRDFQGDAPTENFKNFKLKLREEAK